MLPRASRSGQASEWSKPLEWSAGRAAGVRHVMEQPPEKKPGPIEIPEPPNPREPAPWNPERQPKVPDRPTDRVF
jgi:hypothetical protein